MKIKPFLLSGIRFNPLKGFSRKGLGDYMEKWSRTENYIGESYFDYYVLLSRNRDSGLVEESNFQSALKALNGESDTVKVVRASHWAVGWIEVILIHESDKEAIEKGNEIEESLENYPILDEDAFATKEGERSDELMEVIKKDIANDCGKWWNLSNNATDEEIYDVVERIVSEEW